MFAMDNVDTGKIFQEVTDPALTGVATHGPSCMSEYVCACQVQTTGDAYSAGVSAD